MRTLVKRDILRKNGDFECVKSDAVSSDQTHFKYYKYVLFL